MLEERLRVVVQHDHHLSRRGLCLLLADDPTIQVCTEAATWAEAERALERHAPQAAVVYVGPPYRASLAWVERVCGGHPHVGVVAYGELTDGLVQQLLLAGVRGVLDLHTRPHELMEAVHAVRNRGLHANALLRRQWAGVQAKKATKQQAAQATVDLSTRQEQVLALILHPDVLPYKVIAQRLGITLRAVHFHRAILFTKFHVRSRLALVLAARQWASAPPPAPAS